MSDSIPHPKFQIFRDGFGQYRFRLTAPNSEVIATSEGYTTRQGCRRGIQAVRQSASEAEVEDLTEGEPGLERLIGARQAAAERRERAEAAAPPGGEAKPQA